MPRGGPWPVPLETNSRVNNKIFGFAVSFLLLLTACTPAVTISPPTATPTSGETSTPQPSATLTATALPPSPSPAPSPSATPRANCVERALFVADVTVSDNTRIQAGQPFTKTWQMLNAGTCSWNSDYTLVFIGGNRMSSPATVPLAETAPNATLNLSVDLKAPASDGVFTGLYEIHNPQGKAIPIGLTKSMWVKIMVGNVIVVEEATETTIPGQPAPTSNPTNPAKGPCKPQQSGTGLIDLINSARQAAGLRPLRENAQLTAAAQDHSNDMACHNLFSHTGSDGSSIQDRIVASGYGASDWGEIIYAGGSAQQAFDWWMNDPTHHDMILNPNMKDVGAGYTYVAGSEYGGYFTVDFGTH